jgi:hypothetical protein
MEWSKRARHVIATVGATLPDDMPIKARRKAINAHYPFSGGMSWPYKAWLKAMKQHLARFQPKYQTVIPESHLSPLERMMAKAERKGQTQ